MDLPAGSLLFEEGDKGDHAYVINEGEIDIVKITDDREMLIARRGPGEVIGEMALLDVAPRMASARASTDASLLSIPKRTSTTSLRAVLLRHGHCSPACWPDGERPRAGFGSRNVWPSWERSPQDWLTS